MPCRACGVIVMQHACIPHHTAIGQALGLTLWVLNDERTRENLVSALIAALTNDRFRAAASDFAVEWLERPEVRVWMHATHTGRMAPRCMRPAQVADDILDVTSCLYIDACGPHRCAPL